MINKKYTTAIEVAKSPGDVFDHVIQLPKWWPEEFVGEKIGFNTEFIFKTGDGHFSKNKVIDFEPNKKLAWLTTESFRKTDDFNWSGTKMIVELSPKGNNTVITFTYDGVVPDNEQDRLAEICDLCIKDRLYKFIESFSATIEVAKSSHEVFNCITDVTNWWSKDFEGSSKNLNDEFIIHHPGQHYSKQKLVEVIPDEKIVWLVAESMLYWIQNNEQEWTNTKMIFEITTAGNKTILHFTHEGLVPEKECYAMCEKGWGTIIKNWLFHYITYDTASSEMAKAAEIRNQMLAENSQSK
jgi:uncharacterized protein YndB with AHSA1/START domain